MSIRFCVIMSGHTLSRTVLERRAEITELRTRQRAGSRLLEPPQRHAAYPRRCLDLESYLFEFSSAREEFNGRSGSSKSKMVSERQAHRRTNGDIQTRSLLERDTGKLDYGLLSVSIPSGPHLRSFSLRPLVYFYRKINIRR